MKRLPILNTPARAAALCAAAPQCPRAEMHTCRERRCPMHAPPQGYTGCSVLAGEKRRNVSLKEELLHMLRARVHRRQLQSCKSLFFSPATKSSGQAIANAVPTGSTPFLWILALFSHWHSHSQPHHLYTFRVYVCMPPTASHMLGGHIHCTGAVPSGRQLSQCSELSLDFQTSRNPSSALHPGSLPDLFSSFAKGPDGKQSCGIEATEDTLAAFPLPHVLRGLLSSILAPFQIQSLPCLSLWRRHGDKYIP